VTLVLALCALYAIAAPARGQEHFVDEAINRVTVEHMRHGANYYDAMDDSLRRYNGPAGSVRAYRLPTPFLLWRALGSVRAIWLFYVLLVAISAFVLVRLTSAPLSVPLIAWYMLHAARPHDAGGFIDQYLIVELWVVPFVAAALLATVRRNWATAAGLAVVATSFRELAGLLLLAGLAAALLFRRSSAPWLAAIALSVAAFLVHSALVHPHLVRHGTEIALLGTGGPRRVLTMMGVGLPHGTVVGPVLWLFAIGRLSTDRELAVRFGPYLALPLVGFAVGRDYWGFLVVPFALLWAVEGAAIAVDRIRVART